MEETKPARNGYPERPRPRAFAGRAGVAVAVRDSLARERGRRFHRASTGGRHSWRRPAASSLLALRIAAGSDLLADGLLATGRRRRPDDRLVRRGQRRGARKG